MSEFTLTVKESFITCLIQHIMCTLTPSCVNSPHLLLCPDFRTEYIDLECPREHAEHDENHRRLDTGRDGGESRHCLRFFFRMCECENAAYQPFYDRYND